jgi:hypothetical protein
MDFCRRNIKPAFTRIVLGWMGGLIGGLIVTWDNNTRAQRKEILIPI